MSFVSSEICCCGVSELADIHEDNSPSETIAAFIAGLNETNANKWDYSTYPPKKKDPPTEPMIDNLRGAFFFFTQAISPQNYHWKNDVGLVFLESGKNRYYGRMLADYIRRYKLGKLWKTSPQTNPNTGNIITFWTWAPSVPGLKRWYKKQPKKVQQDILNGNY